MKSTELQKFAERKEYLDVKTAGSLSSLFSPDFRTGLNRGLGTGIAAAGLVGVGALVSKAAKGIKERMVLNKQRERILDEITINDPIVSVFESEDPGSSLRAYNTLVRAAPTLSIDPNIATAYLRNAAQTGGAIDFQTIKLLADAETSMQKARNPGGK